MTISCEIHEIFGVPLNHVKKRSNEEALCLIHISWLKYIQKGLKIPSDVLNKNIVDENLLNFFFTSNDAAQDVVWKFISVYSWKKKEGKVHRFTKAHEKSLPVVHLTYAQLIHYVTKTNYKNLWEQAWRRYHCIDGIKKNKHKQSYNDSLREVLKRLFKTQRTERHDGVIMYLKPHVDSSEENDSIHPNLLQVFCAVESSCSFLLLSEKCFGTLKDCLMYSPCVLNGSTIRPLFVVYQILQVLRNIHDSGLFMGSVTLSELKIDKNLWMQMNPLAWTALLNESWCCNESKSHRTSKMSPHTVGTVIDDSQEDSSLTPSQSSRQCKMSENTDGDLILPSLVQGWVEGCISNYDYLIALNKLAGREKDNPHCHYVMPWIMNFSAPEGGWRDLSKSKFRLNKGDKQLDLIYESASEAISTNSGHSSVSLSQDTAITVPHHTSEALADITYYVYKARRMPKSFLCQHVRQKWVPAEYPSTIERLQEWTPDECIPEFFSDPIIFKSIHPDLCDLGIPWWCDSPKDFIKKHRDALEGFYVSERMHHWIDLVFGYKLTGASAIKAKNVCLPLVDNHTSVRSHGMVQLFYHPHPHKLSKSWFSRSVAPKTFRSIMWKTQDAKDSGDDDTSSESLGKAGFLKGLGSKPSMSSSEIPRQESRPENQTIVLPKDFNPLSSLSHFESLFSFLAWTGDGKFEDKPCKESKANDTLTYHYRIKDLTVLGCLISEIAASAYCKTLPLNVPLTDRYSNVLQILKMHKHEIPRSLQKVIQLLLQVSTSYHPQHVELNDAPSRFPPVSSSGLPLPSPHQLLIPAIHIIPFPAYFPSLYSFLLDLKNFSVAIKLLSEGGVDDDKQKQIQRIAEKKVHFAVEQLQVILPLLNSEGIEMLIPYLQELFDNQHTALLAIWHLFGLVSQALGPLQTCRKLLPFLIKIFETEIASPKHLKLYHRTFLLQLIVGLGLHNFLTHFTAILIEAIGGCKDYSPNSPKGECPYPQRTFNSELKKLNQVPEHLDECFSESRKEENSFSQINSSHEAMHSEINNEEDNEIFDLDLNDEVLKERETFNSASVPKDKKSDDETELPADNTCFIPEECIAETDDSCSVVEQWNSLQDAYSQSAPNLRSHITEFENFKKDEQDNDLNYTEKDVQIKIHSTSYITKYCCLDDTGLSQDVNVSDISFESLLWLAHRLGPVLTARYLTRNLLRMLTLCYDSAEKREIVHLSTENKDINMLSISCKWLKGDINAFKVLDFLSRIASLYGEQFIMLQYMKHIADLLNLCRKKVPAPLESGLHGAMVLLQHIIPYLSDKTLMDHLQDVIIKDVLLLVLRLVSSLRIVYPSGGTSRSMIVYRMLDVIYTIGLRIGFEMTRKLLSGVLQKFFSCFDKTYFENGECKELKDIISSVPSGCSPIKEQALEEMKETFTPEMAFLSYIPFCKLAGGIHMEKILKNDDLIRNLCMQHDKNTALATSKFSTLDGTANNSASSAMTHRREHSLGQDESFVSGVFGKNVSVVGNRLDVQLGEESHLVMATGDPVPSLTGSTFRAPEVPKYDISLIKRKMDNCQRHLKGNWLAYWEHETGRSEKDFHFDFKQIKLQTFIGHSGTVRTIQALDNENSFLTSSKDKTVKLWSLRSCGDGSAQIPCQWTYNQHRKSVFAVSFLDSLRLVGSCDSTVHIWDPFLGSCIKQLEPTKGSPITVLTAIPAPSMTFLAATTNSTVKFLDARTCRYVHEFKVSVGTTGLIRCLAVSPNGNWLAVGHSTGMISVLDVRTGLLFGTWIGHEGEILQLKAFNNRYFLASSLDHSLTVWKFEDTQSKCNLKGPMEPVTSLCFYGNEVISGTTGNRIGLHTSIDKKALYNSTRLRSDTFKGVLTSMALLPLNRLLLLGTDNGSVVLLS